MNPSPLKGTRRGGPGGLTVSVDIPHTSLDDRSVCTSRFSESRDPSDCDRRHRDRYPLQSEGTYGGPFISLSSPTRRHLTSKVEVTWSVLFRITGPWSYTGVVGIDPRVRPLSTREGTLSRESTSPSDAKNDGVSGTVTVSPRPPT